MWATFYEINIHDWGRRGGSVSKTYQQFLRSSALFQPLTLQKPVWFVCFLEIVRLTRRYDI